ncbi:MAG: gliding motility-associated-like protein [Saprospiraceae bacterium]|jgi:gliding motility-associated-like protein
MKPYILKPYYLKLSCLLFTILTFSNITFAQLNVQVTVNSGTSTTTCGDTFGAADPQWRVNVGNLGWTTYPSSGFCYQDPPFLQHNEPYTCPADLPNYIQVCFRAFEDDGSFCTPSQSCDETICEFYLVPEVGASENHTLSLVTGLSSWGEVNFTLEVNGTYPGPVNDYICNAIDLGVLNPGTSIGDAATSAYTNVCGSNDYEPNPSPNGFFNEQAVWFAFTTNNDPNLVIFNAYSDPSNTGDEINLQFAVFESDNGNCSGNLTQLFFTSENADGFDESDIEDCMDPNTTYYVMVDGTNVNAQAQMDGVFGFEIVDVGATSGGDFKCDALDLGPIPDNGSVSALNQSNHCSSHPFFEPDPTGFVSQRSVWYEVTVPSSGHIIIEGESDPTGVAPIGIQIGTFYSSNDNCNGFFSQIRSRYTFQDLDETLTLQCLDPERPIWIMIDGDGDFTTGIFNLTVSDGGAIQPQGTTELNPILCAGESIVIGGVNFDVSGPYSITIDAFNGCDSVVFGIVEVLPPLASTTDTMICAGQTVTVGNDMYSVSGMYQDVLTTVDGCDSIVTINLTVTSDLTITATQTVEASNFQVADGEAMLVASGGAGGFTYEWSDGQTGTTATNLEGGINYCVTVTDAIGCTAEDCVLILFPSNIATTIEDVLLDCPGYTDGVLNLSVANGAAPYDYSWENLANPTVNGAGTIATEGGVAMINGLAAGTYGFTISDAFGLTIAIANVTEPAAIFTSLNPTLCNGGILSVGMSNYNVSGLFSQTLTSYLGCDSIVSGMLTILDPIGTVLEETLCFGETLTVGNTDYNASGPINETILSFNGCDSTIIGNVNISPQNITQLDATLCFGESIIIDGITYDQTNSFSIITTAFNLCDSLINVNLIIQTDVISNLSLLSEASGPGVSDGIAAANPTGGGGNYTYLWSDGQTAITATNLLAGETVCVTVTDDLGCEVFECIEIAFPSNIEITVVNDTLDCFGDINGSLLLDFQFGFAPYEYNWQNTDNSLSGSGTVNTQNADAVLNSLLPGTYFITVSDAFGEATAEVLVVEPLLLEGAASVTPNSCFNACDGSVSISINGGTTPYQYFWPNGSVTAVLDDLCFGGYEVTVVDASGCSIIESIDVDQPEELIVTTASLKDVTCKNGTDGEAIASINGEGAIYLWDNGEDTQSAATLSAGVHTVTITDGTGCTAIGSVNITEPDEPLEVTINQLLTISCFEGADGSLLAVPSGGVAPYSYSWNTGAANALANNLAAGTFEVTVTDANGCSFIGSEFITGPEEIMASLSTKEVTCPEGENSGHISIDTTFGGGGAYFYSIDGLNFSTDTAFLDLAEGEYSVFVQDIEGCIAEFPVIVIGPDEILLELDDTQTVDLGESVSLDPIYINDNLVFQWTGLEATDCINCPEVQTTPTGTTIYELTVTDTTSSCTATAQQRVEVLLKRDVYIPNAFSPNGDGYNDFFYVNAGPEVARVNSFRIYNRWGAAIYEMTDIPANDVRNGWDGRFKGENVENGVYIYVAEIEFIDGELLEYEGDVTVVK